MMKLVAIVTKCDGSRPISFGGIMHPERRYSPRIKVILNAMQQNIQMIKTWW